MDFLSNPTAGFVAKRTTPVAGERPSPAGIANLVVWLKADSGDLLTTSGGSTPVSDGSTVGKWPDQSGLLNHATQSGSTKPIFRATGGPNSQPTIQFTRVGGIQHLIADTIATYFSGTQKDYTVLVVSAFTDTNPTLEYVLFNLGNSGTVDPLMSVFMDSSNASIHFSQENDATDYVTTNGSNLEIANSFSVWTLTGGSTIKGYKNGGSSDFSLAVSGATTLDRFTLGAQRTTGVAAFGSESKISEVVIYDHVLDGGELNQLGAYFTAKYGIAWTNVALTPAKAAQNAAITGNWLDAGDATGLRTIKTDSFILAGWVKITATTEGYILTKGEDYNTTVDEYSLYVNATSGTITFNVPTTALGTSVSVDSADPLVVNTKAFVVAWFNPADNTINIQLNGGTISSNSITRLTNPASGGNFILFANDDASGGVGLKAVLDEWFFCKNPSSLSAALSVINSTIYNNGSGVQYDSLSAGQKAPLGLVSWWGLDEATAATRKDLNSTNDLTKHGTITQVTPLTV